MQLGSNYLTITNSSVISNTERERERETAQQVKVTFKDSMVKVSKHISVTLAITVLKLQFMTFRKCTRSAQIFE